MGQNGGCSIQQVTVSPGPHRLPHLESTAPFTSLAAVLREFFGSRGVEAYLVGGSIRDALMGRTSHDVDAAVQGDALALGRDLAQAIGGAFVPMDPERGVARVVCREGGPTIDLAAMQGSVEDDMARRDFTIDAMALPIWAVDGDWTEALIDPFDGREDLERGLVRMVGEGIFEEDPSRLLRGVRLARSLEFSIHRETADKIREQAHLVDGVAAERVRDEFLTLVSLDAPAETLHCLDELGLLCRVVPELEHAKNVGQPKEHYWDVFEHTVQAVEAAFAVTNPAGLRDSDLLGTLLWDEEMEGHFDEVVSDGHSRRTMLKLGALFHDIAKPQTKAVDATGRTRFLGHPTQGAEMAEERLRELRISARGIRSVSAMVKAHLRPVQMSQELELPSPRAIYRFFRDLDESAYSVLYLSLADYLAARGPMLEMEDWLRHVDLVNYVVKESRREAADDSEERRPLLTGHDLIAVFGLEPGPIFRRLLDGLEDARAASEVNSREEALTWVKARLEEGIV